MPRQGPPVKHPRLRNRKSAEWDLENNTACYGQKKRGRPYGPIQQSVFASPSVSHIPQNLQPRSRIKCERYILIKKCCGSFLHLYIFNHHKYTIIFIFTNPSARAGYDTRSIFKRSLTGLNSELSFSSTSYLTKAEKPSLPYYLPIAGGRIIGFKHFPRVLVLCKMQSASSRI